MTDSTALDKNLAYHAAAGTLFAVLLFAALLLAGYRDKLVEAEDSLVRIRRNLVVMEASITDLREKKRLLRSAVPAGYQTGSNREMMLLAVEKARARIPGAKLSVTGFEEQDGELALGVVFEFPVYDYGGALKAASYLEGRGLPYFMPTGMTIRRVEGTSDVEGRVEGSFRMPAGRTGTVNGG